eukprot:CAMPEP_0172553086 /NCGR_PEP_ID=MMETSP1067-20121228/48391_1 /TAXON_ID=265564 ORGANISM="Thalassiosira punctigera, Strain Tpunct2005C2" /NCGR_SAMPLE_ID=MMETSP1067 /ASSEMBLY_ACC=CAM_ASM_000444 /LENGTH=327 /DNA_ID=CAMNT_0013341193 /DNA_START=70 /DNA_END=1053 /DNA_ORIENTATION=+
MAYLNSWKSFRYVFIAIVSFAAKDASSFIQLHCVSRSSLTKSCQRYCEALPDFHIADESTVSSPFVIALTREDGKNVKLRNALVSNERIGHLSDSYGFPVQLHELPCIEHAHGPDAEKLPPTLSSSQYDYIVITSPEAAKVMASAWIEVGRPKLGMVAAVGKATQETLNEFGIDVAFVPSKATAATLVKELPPSNSAIEAGRATTAFYPASAKAKDTLQNGLEKRGFTVFRLNTYDTVPASWDADQISLAQCATVACFASPSAVKAWLKNTAHLETPRALASCIGETSATACRENHWAEKNIFYPEKPGIDGWTNAVADALEYLTKT